MAGDKERCLVAGMDDYIEKLIAIDNLAGILSRCQPYKSCIWTFF